MLKLIKTTVLDASAASVTIDNIPQQFKSLKLLISARSDRSALSDELRIRFNGSTTNYTYRRLYGTGSAAGSDSGSSYSLIGDNDAASATASTFSNAVIDIPNYSGSTNKPVSSDLVSENNATAADSALIANLWSNTAAITSITLVLGTGPNFVAGTTVYLYGIA